MRWIAEPVLIKELIERTTGPRRRLGGVADRHHADEVPRSWTLDEDLDLFLDPVRDEARRQPQRLRHDPHVLGGETAGDHMRRLAVNVRSALRRIRDERD